MKLLFMSDSDRIAAWRAVLADLAPEIELVDATAPHDPDDIELALVWQYPPGALKRYRRLRLVSSLGAGIDHLLRDPDFPAGVPFVRLVDPTLTRGMVEYALAATLRYHRQMVEYAGFQAQAQWHPLPAPTTSKRRVGVAGVGEIGGAVARAVAGLGFDVAGWSRRAKADLPFPVFAGADGWKPFLARTDILICVLPLTDATRGLLDAACFAALPQGAFVVNIARGKHLNAADLLSALDSFRLAHATLDVTDPEPLPPDHPLWRHPRVTLTPHIASLTDPHTAAPQVVANIRNCLSGKPLANVVDRANGY
jgi:glyoxylate/hydroxypyruvate reductase A